MFNLTWAPERPKLVTDHDAAAPALKLSPQVHEFLNFFAENIRRCNLLRQVGRDMLLRVMLTLYFTLWGISLLIGPYSY